MDIRRPPGGDIESWRFVGAEGLTSVEGLYKIRVNTNRPFTARNLEITSEDLVVALHEGTVYLVECDEGVTGLVLIGRGEVRFSPTSAAERGQVKLFSGNETLTSPFEEAYIRLSPSDYEKRVTTASLTASAPQERLTRRALDIFARESTKSFNVDLQDLSSDAWYLLPTGGRLPRGGRYPQVRRPHVHAFVAASGRHHPVPAEGSAHDRVVSLGRQARRSWPLLQRRCVARLRRAGLQHRRQRGPRTADDPGPGASRDSRPVNGAVECLSASQRSTRRHRRDQC